tara:strand:- start:258 stop:476 length:219 start_codon:yes stop_codon:yes gene_type:complete
MAYEKIAVKINRRDGDGVYYIQSIKGSVTLTVIIDNQDEKLRVGDEVSEKEVEYLVDRHRSYSVTISSVKGG